jgi:hypothetical protein
MSVDEKQPDEKYQRLVEFLTKNAVEEGISQSDILKKAKELFDEYTMSSGDKQLDGEYKHLVEFLTNDVLSDVIEEYEISQSVILKKAKKLFGLLDKGCDPAQSLFKILPWVNGANLDSGCEIIHEYAEVVFGFKMIRAYKDDGGKQKLVYETHVIDIETRLEEYQEAHRPSSRGGSEYGGI